MQVKSFNNERMSIVISGAGPTRNPFKPLSVDSAGFLINEILKATRRMKSVEIPLTRIIETESIVSIMSFVQ